MSNNPTSSPAYLNIASSITNKIFCCNHDNSNRVNSPTAADTIENPAAEDIDLNVEVETIEP